jgi:hypothetical protein
MGLQLLTSNSKTGTIDIIVEAPTAQNFAAVSVDPGTWTTQVIPEPSSILLLATVLAGIWLKWARKVSRAKKIYGIVFDFV